MSSPVELQLLLERSYALDSMAAALQLASATPPPRLKTRVGAFNLAAAALVGARVAAARQPHWEKRGEVRRSAMGSRKYLSPEPMLQDSRFARRAAEAGHQTLAYSYAQSNPTVFSDPDGNRVNIRAYRHWGDLFDAYSDLNSCNCVHEYFKSCYGSDPFTDSIDHDFVYDPDDVVVNFLCEKMDGLGRTFRNKSNVCPVHFTYSISGYLGDREGLMGTMMHELAHQMSFFKTDHGITRPGAKCSAEEAEELGEAIARKGCAAVCGKKCQR